MMDIFELTSFVIKFLPMLHSYKKYSKITIKEFVASKFKRIIIREILCRWMNDDYKMSSFLYVLQEACKKNAGMVEGGSLAMIDRIVDRYKSLRGKLCLNKPIKKIVVENGVAKGIKMPNDEIINADYVVAAYDVHHTFYDLLDNKYTTNILKKDLMI